MHIIIGIITAIAGLIWALRSLQNAGVDLNSFSPFTWARRRRWEKQLGVKPIHALTDSMEVAALLVVAMAKTEGEITRESKMEILAIFEEEFAIQRKKSIEMFSSSANMLQNIMSMDEEVKHVLAPSITDFQESHVQKLLKMLNKAAALEGEATAAQLAIIQAVEMQFNSAFEKTDNW